MKKLFGLLLITFFALQWPTSVNGQIHKEDLEILQAQEDTLALLGYAIINDSLAEHRFGACREMIPRLVTALKAKNSFKYPFERLKSVSIQYPADSSFRVFTWQLYVDVNEYRYYGAIQMNTPDLKLFPLVDRSYQMQGNLEQQIHTPDQWYGALYYNIKEVVGPKGKYYLLFGFDAYQFFHKRKLIEVLSFQNGKPQFGAPVFMHGEEKAPYPTKNRVLREYSAEVSTKLNFDEIYEMIIFDHLIARAGQYGEGPTFYPDGSYEGYKFENGYWNHIVKVFDQISEEAPRPEPILDNRSRDIFGSKKKN